MKNKLLCLLLAVMVLVSYVPFCSIEAVDTPQYQIEDKSIQVGDTFTIAVAIDGNPGIISLRFRVIYDAAVLELQSVANNGILNGFTTPAPTIASPYTLRWADSLATENNTVQGTVAILTFKTLQVTDSTTISIEHGEARNASGTKIAFANATATITVKEIPVAATGVELNKESLSLTEGESETLIATVLPDNATNKVVTWESSDSTIATVDDNGKVIAVKKGTATITVTTEDGTFTDTCEVSVSCSHASTTIHTANDSTCLVQGNEEYTTCDDCGIVVSGSDVKLPFGDHTGGTATCKEQAICNVCTQPYGSLASHVLTKHSANSADHDNAGNIEYWTCDICDKYFNDATGENEITEEDIVIGVIPHDHSSEWSNNDQGHWHECSCGNKADVAEHDFDNDCDTACNVCGYTRIITHQWNSAWTTDGENHWIECGECGETKDIEEHNGGSATCEKQAICVDCQQPYGDLAEHNYVENADEKYLLSEATCVDKAVYSKSCSMCGVASSTETFEYGEVDAKNHVGNTYIKDQKEATCIEEGYTGDTMCNSCDQLITAGQIIGRKEHNPASVWSTDENNHWKDCQTIGCGNIIDKAPHSGGNATCVNKAICEVCQVEYGAVDANNHAGETEIRDAIEETCDKEGYTGDTYCKDCGEKIATGVVIPATGNHVDADGKWETDVNNHYHTCTCGEIINSASHSGGIATCVNKAICEVCQVEYGAFDANNHAGETEIRDAVEETCDEEGYSGDTYCKDCGEKIATGMVIPTGHKVSHVDATEATHEEDGNIAHYICAGCEKLFADSDATTEITREDIVIAKGEHSYGESYESDMNNHWKACGCGNIVDQEAHTFGDWVVTKEATEKEKGSKEKICSVCDYKVVEEIPVAENENNNNDGTTDVPPQTGDSSVAFLWLMLVVVGIAFVSVKFAKKTCLTK